MFEMWWQTTMWLSISKSVMPTYRNPCGPTTGCSEDISASTQQSEEMIKNSNYAESKAKSCRDLRSLVLYPSFYPSVGLQHPQSAPTGYYNKAENKCGKVFCSKRFTHHYQPYITDRYSGVWIAYQKEPTSTATARIWDMYSTKRWVYGKEQCGNYTSIGSCYNREHSFPRAGSTTSTYVPTFFHLYPPTEP